LEQKLALEPEALIREQLLVQTLVRVLVLLALEPAAVQVRVQERVLKTALIQTRQQALQILERM